MNVFDLYAKISLDSSDYEKELNSAKGKFSGFADGIKGAAGKVGDVLAGIGKTAAVGIGAAGTALTALTKQSLDAVANFEQLKGGVDKIFGESSVKVLDYANKAYSEAGLSANQYMETVTSFSASLIQSLDGNTEAAADAANRAIIDMADNVNTYGSSMDSVMNAYQGFAKQNYTMLDNLKLGYGGTKEEMQRLITDAAGMNEEMQKIGVTVDADSLSFGNIVNAISVMQEHMNIAGTTHKEAAKTISGSVASMKAAWQNFLTGTGSPAQFTEVLKNSIGNIRNNLSEIIPRLTEGMTELVDLVAPEIPPIIEQTLPAIITGASALITGLSSRLPELLTATLPALSAGVVNVSTAIVGVMPELVSSLSQSIPIVIQTIWSKKDELLKAGKDLVSSLFPSDMSKVPEIMTSAASTITTFAADITDPKNLKAITDKGFEVINSLLDGLTRPETLAAFMDPEHGVIKIVENIGEGLVHFSVELISSATQVIKNLGDYLNNEENRQQLFTAAKEILVKIGKGLTSTEARDAVGGLIVESAKFIADMFIGGIDWDAKGGEIARQIIQGVYNNLWTTKIGTWIGESIEGITHADLHDYLESGTTLSLEGYQESVRDSGNSAAYSALTGIPSNMGEYYMQKYTGHFATGFYADRPAVLNNTLVGEAGDEVLLPLENNTGWMDKLADKLGGKINGSGGGDFIVNVYAPTGNANDILDVLMPAIDEKLSDMQIRGMRGYGGAFASNPW